MTIPQSHRKGLWYGHWRPRSKKVIKKPVCETVVWPLAVKKPGLGDRGIVIAKQGQKPEHRCPLSIKTSPYWWMTDAGVRIGALEVLMDDGCRRSGFSPYSPVTIPWSHGPGFFNVSGHTMVSQTGFFLSLFRCRTSVTISRTRSVKLWYGHWRPSLKYQKKKNQSDRPWYGHWH